MTRIRVPTFTVTLALGLISWMPIMANADLVMGKVNPVPKSKSFKIINSKGVEVKKSPVKTDAKGNFVVTLRPGKYTAKSDKGQASIRSSNRPLLGQTINFKIIK